MSIALAGCAGEHFPLPEAADDGGGGAVTVGDGGADASLDSSNDGPVEGGDGGSAAEAGAVDGALEASSD